MSETTPPNSSTPSGGRPIPGGGRVWGQSRRASVSLREQSGEQTLGSMLDPATQSLADALRITFRLLQVAMVVLVALFFLSGAQSVKEGERGIRLVFGKVVDADVSPGFRLSWPRPIGELVKVGTSPQTVRIDRAFFPELSAAEESMLEKEGSQKLAGGGRPTLNPEVDGSNLTADGSIAHTRWEVKYIRKNAKAVQEHVNPDDEVRIVTAAIKRGVVQALASLTVDELLKGEFAAVAGSARRIAQETLNNIGGGSGLEISQLTLTTAIAPRGVMTDFNRVELSRSTANTNLENAKQERTRILNEAAGAASETLIAQIDRYEGLLAGGDIPVAEAALATIDSLLSGSPVTIDNQEVNPPVYGEVTRILNDAREYKTGIVNGAVSDVALFNAKRESFKSNPLVLINGDWTSALAAVLRQPTVTLMTMPRGVQSMVLELNRDPEIARKQEIERNTKEGEEQRRQRMEDLERRRRGG